MRYALRTFGCQMNLSDSERLHRVMQEAGFKIASEKAADILIVNTCSVRQSAEDRATGQIHLGRQRGQKIVITGCLANQASFVKKFRTAVTFISITDIGHLPNLLMGQRLSPLADPPGTEKTKDRRHYLEIPPLPASPVSAYVPIMTGCNNYCSYCIVPYVRGRERSRPARAIMSEIKGLIKKGYRQITLLGQNVNNYQSGQTNFTKLLEKIAKLPGNFRVFFITSHPKDFNRRIISLVARYPKLCPYFHLPVQSGSNRILKKMNRHYTREKYLQIIRAIRRRIPHAAITTDIIVGFPGETKTDFEQSARLCRTARFDQAYIARYSPRPGTTSAKLRDTVSLKEKKRRARVLTRIVEKTAREQNLRHMGHATQVLVETSHRKNGQFLNLGKNECSKSVIFKSTKEHWHQIVRVKLTKASVWGLYGQIFESRHLDN